MTAMTAMNRSNSENFLSISEMVYAVQYGDVNYVRKAIAVDKFDVNAVDEDGCSLLQWAAINNRTEIGSILISNHVMVITFVDTSHGIASLLSSLLSFLLVLNA